MVPGLGIESEIPDFIKPPFHRHDTEQSTPKERAYKCQTKRDRRKLTFQWHQQRTSQCHPHWHKFEQKRLSAQENDQSCHQRIEHGGDHSTVSNHYMVEGLEKDLSVIIGLFSYHLACRDKVHPAGTLTSVSTWALTIAEFRKNIIRTDQNKLEIIWFVISFSVKTMYSSSEPQFISVSTILKEKKTIPWWLICQDFNEVWQKIV